MEILWTTAFVDLAADSFDAGVEFWSKALHCEVSPRRGSTDEFATLLPTDGDPFVRVQRTSDGSSGVHLDVHVSDPAAASTEAVHHGAQLVADHGYMIMRSPGGLTFCLVPHHGEATVPGIVGTVPHRLDQLCFDIAPQAYEAECEFWRAVTGWELHTSQLSEFSSLARPPALPLRFLLQRLDEITSPRQPHLHLDIACGDNIEAIAEEHVELGAVALGRTKVWMPMRDPAGLTYCLTPRDP